MEVTLKTRDSEGGHLAWNEMDKAAGLYILVELAAQMKAEEIFHILIEMTQALSDRTGEEVSMKLLTRQPGLAECLRHCLERHGLI
jgi:hypothetical protein